VYGAEVLAVKGNFDRPFRSWRELADTLSAPLGDSVIPYRLQGQKDSGLRGGRCPR